MFISKLAPQLVTAQDSKSYFLCADKKKKNNLNLKSYDKQLFFENQGLKSR